MTAVIDLAAMPPAGLIVPGIAAWLGRSPEQETADFRASLDDGFTESFEDYCTRISRPGAVS